MTFKEILLAVLIPLILGIVIVHYQKYIDSSDSSTSNTSTTPPIEENPIEANISVPPPERILPDNLVTQLKGLQNPNASFGVVLWFNQPGQTRFRHPEIVTINYEVNGLEEVGYLTLLNVSPAGKISMILSEKVQNSKYFKKVNRITLTETGEEYFKAIVTTEPIEWKTFIAAAIRGEERERAWGTTALIVDVN